MKRSEVLSYLIESRFVWPDQDEGPKMPLDAAPIGGILAPRKELQGREATNTGGLRQSVKPGPGLCVPLL